MKEKRDLGKEMFEAMGIKVVDCTPKMSEELKKEWADKLITTLPECDVKVIEDYYSSLLAKQQEDIKKDPLKLIKLHPQYKDLAKEADERIQIQVDAYNDAKEEFVKCIPEIKLIEGHGFQDPRTDYKIGYNQCIADIKSKLKLND